MYPVVFIWVVDCIYGVLLCVTRALLCIGIMIIWPHRMYTWISKMCTCLLSVLVTGCYALLWNFVIFSNKYFHPQYITKAKHDKEKMSRTFGNGKNIYYQLLRRMACNLPGSERVNVKNNNGQSCLMLALMNSDKNMPQLLMSVEKIRADVNHCDSHNTSTFAYACVSENEDMVEILVANRNLDVNKRDNFYYTPISYVCSAGAHVMYNRPRIGLTTQNVKILRRITRVNRRIRGNNSKIAAILLDCDRIDNAEKNQFGNTLVRRGCFGGNDETLSKIIETKAVSVNDVVDISPLHTACNNGNVKSVNHLLNANARLNLKSPFGSTPIMLACIYGDTDIVKLLLTKNVNLSKTLELACHYNHTDVVEVLLSKNVDVNETDKDANTPLMVSCILENAKIVNLLLNKNAIVDKGDRDGCTPLMMACHSGNVKIVQLLLNKNANVDKGDNGGLTPLMVACQENHPKIVELLLSKKPNVNADGGEGNEPALLRACRNKNAKIVSLLLKANCNVNVVNSNGYTPLMEVCYQGDVDNLQMLLKRGVDVNMTTTGPGSPGGINALMLACQKGDGKIVELLLKNGASIKMTRGRSPMSFACNTSASINTDIVDQLLSRGAKVDELFAGRTPLLFACEIGNIELASLLIDYKADVNFGNCSKDITPLMQSSIAGHADIVTLLLNENADVNATSRRGNTTLIYACRHEKVAIVAQLMIGVHKVKVNHANVRGVTALMTACYRRNDTIVELLIRANACVNCSDAKGCTPLMWASHSGCVENVAALLGSNAAVNRRDRRGGTALMRACKFSSDDVVKEILKADGVEINATTHKGNTALIFACEAGNAKVVSLFVESNVDVSVINNRGQNALDIAKSLGHEEIVAMLQVKFHGLH